jgi:hypothetical protein
MTNTNPAGRCPVCGRPAEAHTRPFCSKRCADLDLARWLNEDYRIATDEAPGDGDGGGDGGGEREPKD